MPSPARRNDPFILIGLQGQKKFVVLSARPVSHRLSNAYRRSPVVVGLNMAFENLT